jgi:hypothetical protein
MNHDIIIYADIYIQNELGKNPDILDYYKYALEVRKLGLDCVPYDNILLYRGSLKYLVQSLNITNTIFQFKCKLFDINLETLKLIKDKFNKAGFFYIDSFETTENRINELNCEILSKIESNMIKFILMVNMKKKE